MRCEVCDLTSDSKIIDELFESGKNIHVEIEAIKRQTEKITS